MKNHIFDATSSDGGCVPVDSQKGGIQSSTHGSRK